MSVNKVILLGNLGKDPELRYTPSNVAVSSFSIATNERRKDQSGNWGDHTEWHNIIVFGKVAENCNKYLKKGRQAYIEGRLQTRKWQDKEGKDRYTTEIIANTVQFIGVKADRDSNDSASEGYSGGGVSAMEGLKSGDSIPPMSAGDISFDDDDIPF